MTDLPLNHNAPTIMHVDLNSCFATIEQQANPLLRGKPIVVAAYDSPNGCVVAPSIEAKRYGIKTGMTVRDARLLYPGVIDPFEVTFSIPKCIQGGLILHCIRATPVLEKFLTHFPAIPGGV